MFNDLTWKDSEQKVQQYMKNKGFKILETNFSCVGVELDIVAILSKSTQKNILKQQTKQRILEDKKNKSIYKNSLKNALKHLEDLLVITEVKGRETDKFGLGLDSISDKKKSNIIRGARYLQTQKQYEKYQIRFDVASVDSGKVTYIENAF
jgi:Holliday junction resolvase-like predicted endonuclease